MKLFPNHSSRQPPVWAAVARAFTLAEMMTTMGIFSMVVLGMVSLQVFAFKMNAFTSSKLIITADGLKATYAFKAEGIKTNVTLCFSATQGLMAAKAGATYVSPFIGRLDDINLDGVELIEQIRTIYDNYNFTTQILAASIRSPNHVTEVAIAGADVATIPPAVIYKLADHPLTKSGLEQFVKDWKSTGQSIL